MNYQNRDYLHEEVEAYLDSPSYPNDPNDRTKRNRVTFAMFPPPATAAAAEITTTTEDEERQQKQYQEHDVLLPEVLDEEAPPPKRPSSSPSLLPSSSNTRRLPSQRISFTNQESAISSIDDDITIDSSSATSSNGGQYLPRKYYRTISTGSDKSNGGDSNGGEDGSQSNNGRGWRTLRKLLADGELAFTVSEATRNRKHKRQESIRQQVFDDFHTGINFSVSSCLISILGYICVSILLFSFLLEPSWSIIDSCYFAVTTFTTVGYGDLSPTTTISRIFTCIYALLGVMTLGLALGALGNRIIERHQHAKSQRDKFSKFQIMSLFDTDSTRTIVKDACNELQSSTKPSSSMTTNYSSSLKNKSVLRAQIYDKNVISKTRSAVLVVVVFILTCLIGYDAGWKIMDTFYFLIITGCTIGYGDITPTTELGRLVAIIYIPLACLMTGHALTYIAQNMVDKKANEFFSQYKAKELTQDDIDAMDTNGDGKVSWAEFLEFMLVAMNKIDYELIDELQDHFQKLDVGGTGELSRSGLAAMARRKLLNPRRKLELCNYKRYLMKQAQKARNDRRRGLLFGWIPQIFRRHDNIRAPWRHHDIENGEDYRTSMQEAADEVAAMVENKSLDPPHLARFESADYPNSRTKEYRSKRLSLPMGSADSFRDYGTLSR